MPINITFFEKNAKNASLYATVTGRVAERLKAPLSKSGMGESSSRVEDRTEGVMT